MGLAIGALGCGPRAAIELIQPHAPPAQQHLKLESDWAYLGPEGPRRLCLLDFPRPISRDGPRDFRLLLSLPAAEGMFEVNPDGDAGARGFLIQAVGKRSGKTVLASGRVTLRTDWMKPRERVLELDVAGEDGSQIVGAASLRDDEQEVRAFARAFEADVAALEARASAVAHAVDRQPDIADAQGTQPSETTASH